MNIFILDTDKTKCAQYHLDRHVVKMILEYAQLLSTACRHTGLDVGYRSTHINHPCSKWVRESKDNWLWLRDLSTELNREYTHRYGKSHKSYDVIKSLPVPNLPDKGLTKFALAMPDEYKVSDPVQSYRNYYNGGKVKIATWKNRNKPYWFNG